MNGDGLDRVNWDAYENELDNGVSLDEPPIEPIVMIFWCAALVGGLAFWTVLGIFVLRALT